MTDELARQPALRKWQESVYGKGPYQVPDYESMAAIVQEHEQMASRIEELEAGLQKMELEFLDAASKSYQSQLKSEAKLAKLVKALEFYAYVDDDQGALARKALEEIGLSKND